MSKKFKKCAFVLLGVYFLAAILPNTSCIKVRAAEVNTKQQISLADGFVNMTVPEVWNVSNGDINMKLAILNLKDFSKADIFINDSEKPFYTVTDANTAVTDIKLPLSMLNRAKNKVVVKAYSKTSSSKIYMQTKYINIIKNDNTYALKTNLKAVVKAASTVNDVESDSYKIMVWSPTNSLPYDLQFHVIADGDMTSYYMDYDGYVRIPKSVVDGKSNVRITTMGQTDDGVFYYSNREWNSDVTEIKALTTTKNISIKSDNPITGSKLVGGKLRIYGNINEYSSLQNIYSLDLYDDIRERITTNNYSFWYDEDNALQLNMDMKFDNNKQYSIWTDIVDTKLSTGIIFDEAKVSKVVLVPQVSGKYDGLGVSFSKNVDEIYKSEQGYEYYISKGSYENLSIELSFEESDYYSYFSRDNYIVSDDVTYVSFGGNLTFTPVGSYDGFTKEVYLGGLDITDEYGNTFNEVQNTTGEDVTAYLYDKSGKLVFQGKPNDNLFLNISTVEAGVYNIVVDVNNKSLGVLRTQPNELVTEDQYEIALTDSNNVYSGYDGYVYSLYDENNNEVYRGSMNKVLVPKSLVDTTKKYKLYMIAECMYFSSNEVYEDALILNDISFQTDGGVQDLEVDTSALKYLSVTDDFYTNTKMKIAGSVYCDLDESKKFYGQYCEFKGLRLQKGLDYFFYTNRLEQNNEYFLCKKYTPNDTDNSIAFDKTNLTKLNVSSNINSKVNNITLDLKGNNEQNINVNITSGHNIYLSKDIYSTDVAFNVNTSPYRVRGSYGSINAINDITELKLGSAIKLNGINITDTAVTPGSLVNLTIGDIYDGTVLLKDLNKAISTSGISPAIEVMHGNKAIKTYEDGKIPSTIGGEVSLRVNYSNVIPGLITNVSTVNVANALLDGKVKSDINLDGIIDVFDIIYVAKDIDKAKRSSTDWDPRCNLNNTDGLNKIDILDVAEVAKNYN